MGAQELDIKVRDLLKTYHDNGDSGIVDYGRTLDIRPPFQREFIFKG